MGTMRKLGELVTGCGGRFLAAPVAGHSGMAVAATCQSICAGDDSLFKEATPALEQLSKNIVWLGTDVGAASNTKLVINGLMANITASFAEALAVAEGAELSQDALMELIGGHAMNSPLLQLCANRMRSSNHEPALFMLKHMAKDARLQLELAQSVLKQDLDDSLAVAPVSAATSETYASAVQAGLGDANWTAVHEVTTKRESNANADAAGAPTTKPCMAAESVGDYVRLYQPTCAAHVFDNHFEAFGEQSLEKIMLDYTEASVVEVFNWSSGELETKTGRTEISEMFAGFWAGMAPGGWGKMEAPVRKARDEPVRCGFLIWSAPENKIALAQDTFIYSKNFKIATQTFAGRVG